MKRLAVSVLVVVAGILASCAPSATVVQTVPTLPAYTGPKANLVVAQFDCQAASCGSYRGTVGGGISDALLTALVQSGRYSVFESAETVGLLEAELAVTGSDPAFAKADLAVIGTITDFNPKASGIASGLTVPVPFLGNVGGGTSKSTAAMDLRVVDVRTRQIIAVTKVKGEASGFDANAQGYFRGFGGDLGGYSNTSMETAVATMIDAAVLDLIGKIPADYYGRPPAAQASTGSGSEGATEASTVDADSAGNLDGSVKIIPGNSFPFEDGFENFSLGQVVAVAAPQNYGIFRTDGKDDPNFAKIEETFNAEGQASKTIQINTTTGYHFNQTQGFLTFGSQDSQNYRAAFDFKTSDSRAILELQLNMGQGASTRFEVRIGSGGGWVTLDKVLGDQKVQLVNRDNLGFQFADNAYHQAEVISQSGMVQVIVDGRTLIEYQDQDAKYAQGGLGIGASTNSNAPIFIDNLRITDL